jgi:hypothetical protein
VDNETKGRLLGWGFTLTVVYGFVIGDYFGMFPVVIACLLAFVLAGIEKGRRHSCSRCSQDMQEIPKETPDATMKFKCPDCGEIYDTGFADYG